MAAPQPTISKDITAGDVFTDAFQSSEPFMISLEEDPGSNVVRLQRRMSDGSTYQNATDEDGVELEFTAAGTYPIYPVSLATVWRVGVPTEDYSSGSVMVVVEGTGLRTGV